MTEPVPSATRRLAAFAIATNGADLPASAVAFARLSLLDWSAVALAGIGEPVSVIVREMVARDGGAADATVLGLNARLPARAAALANGATSHALDYDDTHFGHIGHPSVAVLPAALAVAEREGTSGAELVAAFLVGVETACRVGALLGPGHYRHGFHQTATSGSFGAAAACARLLGLDVDATCHALGLVATRASGLKSQFGTMGKPFHAGMAAANGVEAADLAALGFVSRPDGLECEQGFTTTHAGAPDAVDDALAGLGEAYLFEAVQYKLHACCHGTHAALEALTTLRREHAIAPDAVAAVTLTVNPTWLRVCDLPTPATGLEAKFSYRLTAAMALAGVDTAALASFSDAACRDPRLVPLRDRVEVVADAALPDTAARVVVALDDGHRLEATHDLEARWRRSTMGRRRCWPRCSRARPVPVRDPGASPPTVILTPGRRPRHGGRVPTTGT
jgi:2-methylcitrate dehydratase PrpD